MIDYSRKNLKMAHEYMKTLKPGTAAHTFCEIPLALAEATVTIIEQGLPKVHSFINIAHQTTSYGNLQDQCVRMINLYLILVLISELSIKCNQLILFLLINENKFYNFKHQAQGKGLTIGKVLKMSNSKKSSILSQSLRSDKKNHSASKFSVTKNNLPTGSLTLKQKLLNFLIKAS